MWRVYLISGVVAAVVAAGTAFFVARLAVPMAQPPEPAAQPPGVSEPPSAGAPPTPAPRQPVALDTVVLEGEVEVPLARGAKDEVQVFYKAAFALPPHLTCTISHGNFPLTDFGIRVGEQTANGFKLRRDATSGAVNVAVKWRAEGRLAPASR